MVSLASIVSKKNLKKGQPAPFKPLLASPDLPDDLRFPLYASPKMDGIRGLIFGQEPLSRSLKTIPNQFVQDFFANFDHDGLDGEFIVGEPYAKDVYRKTMSAIMSEDGEPDFSFYAFDDISNPDAPFHERHEKVLSHNGPGGRLVVLPQQLCVSLEELNAYEAQVLTLGYEGLVVRSPQGYYKFGRSTANEQIMLKVKRFTDSEARIIGMEEEMHNANEAKKNELGETERSSHKENLVGKGRMGALIGEQLDTKIKFRIGTGFSAKERQWFWDNKDKLIGGPEIIKFKYFEVGVKDLPRHSVYLGFRDKRDMS